MIKESIYINLNINPYDIFFKKHGVKTPVYTGQVIDAILEGRSGPEVARLFNRGEQTFNRAIRKLFPDIKLSGGQSWKIFLLDNSDYRECVDCKEIKLKSYFNFKGNNRLTAKCKDCQSTYWSNYYTDNKASIINSVAIRRAKLKRSIPKWANLDKIKEIYKNCPEGHHVDHIYPLQGINSCGLHVETNLQYLPAKENLSKGNKEPF